MNFVFDLDGTIYFKGQPLSSKITEALLDLIINAGHEVIFALARPIRDMLPVLDERFHHFPLIGGNGSLGAKDGKVIHAHSFSSDVMDKIKKHIQKYEARYLTGGEWDDAYTGDKHHPILQNLDPAKLAKCVPLETLETIVKILEELAQNIAALPVNVHRHKNENLLDISPKGINKWSSLKMFGILEKSYVAFGNDANDIPMFEQALHSVMIGHHEELANFAKKAIELDEETEQKNVEKIHDLGNRFMKFPNEVSSS